jgi:hypothetical protein
MQSMMCSPWARVRIEAPLVPLRHDEIPDAAHVLRPIPLDVANNTLIVFGGDEPYCTDVHAQYRMVSPRLAIMTTNLTRKPEIFRAFAGLNSA